MDVIQLSSGKLDFSSTQVDLEGVLLEWNRTGATIRSIEVYRGSGLMFGFVRQSPKPLKSFGHEFDSGHAVVWQPDNPLEYIAPLGLTSLVIHVDSTLVDLLGWIVRGTAWQRVPQSHLAKLEETCRLATSAVAKMCSAATTAERDEFIGPWRDRILASLETALEPWLAVQSPVDATDPGTRHFRLFKDAEQIFQQYDPGSTPGIDAVAATIGVPRRTFFTHSALIWVWDPMPICNLSGCTDCVKNCGRRHPNRPPSPHSLTPRGSVMSAGLRHFTKRNLVNTRMRLYDAIKAVAQS